jgi:hypothetical protein
MSGRLSIQDGKRFGQHPRRRNCGTIAGGCFRSYGLPETSVTSVAEAIRNDRRRWIEFMMKFELGTGQAGPGTPFRSAWQTHSWEGWPTRGRLRSRS